MRARTLAAGLLAALGSLTPLSCAAGADEPPATEYRVVKEEVRDLPDYGKIKQDVIVKRDATEAELRSVLLALRAAALKRTWKSEKPPGMWIYLYEDESTATAKPDQWLAMLGSSPDAPAGQADITILSKVTKPISPPNATPGRDIIGSWRHSSAGFHRVKTLYRESGQIKQETKFDDGSSAVETVVQGRHPDGVKYADPTNQHGDFVVVYPDGTLGLYDTGGKWGTATPLR